jgi:endonuclease YncB( thermonuclease family)
MSDIYAQLVKAAAAKTWDFPRADVLVVHDGDTVDLNVTFTATIDAGFNQAITTTSTQPHSFRLFGCNANELADPGGPEARDNLAAMLPIGTRLRLSSVKDDKFGGRYDAVLWARDMLTGEEYNVVQRLIDTHWAVPWNGNGAKPKPPWPRPEDVHA